MNNQLAKTYRLFTLNAFSQVERSTISAKKASISEMGSGLFVSLVTIKHISTSQNKMGEEK